MFGVLNNTLQLQGTNVALPASAVAIGTTTAAASLHIQQTGTTSSSGILLQGPDNKKWGLNYSGTALAFTEDQQSRLQLMNGGNVDIGAGLHIAGDLQVDGSINVFGGTLTTIQTTATTTHMMKVTNNGTGPAITAVQLQPTQSTFEAYHGTILALQVASNTCVGISLPQGAPSQALDVGGNTNASGFSQATNFITVGSPVASNTNIGSTTGGYLAWNRNASGAVMLANAKGTLAGGWEFVSYNADGSFNQVPAAVSDAGDIKLAGSGSLAGSLSVTSNITATNLNITGAYASLAGNLQVGSSLAAGSLSGTFSTVAGFAYVGSSLAVGSLVTATALNVTGPFASIAGNTAVGSNLTVGSLLSATTLYIKGPYASIAGNINVGSNLVAGSVISSTVLNVTGPYASVAGNASIGSNLSVGSVVTATALSINGPYASISGYLATGSTAQLYNALVGDVGFGTNSAGFQNNSLAANQANYAMQQQSDGTTAVNAALGKILHLRNNNNTLANVSASGVRVGDSAVAAYPLDVSGSSRVANNAYFGTPTPLTQGLWQAWNKSGGNNESVFINQSGTVTNAGGFQFMNFNGSNILQNTPLTILGSGLIGVSNTSPTVALDVLGQGKFSSTLTALSIAGTTLAVTGTLSVGGQLSIGSNLLTFTPGYINNGSGSVSSANGVMVDLPGTGTISFADTLMNYGMLGINCVPSYSIDVTGNVRATGNAIINNASIGTVNGLAGAVFANNAMMTASNYAVLQSAAGQTNINATTGQAIILKNNNVNLANFTPSGLRLGDANAAASTLDVGGNANVQTTLSALNLAGTTLNINGTFASVTGSLSVGSSLSVGTVNPLTVLPGLVFGGSGTIAASNSTFFNLAGVGTISFNDTIVNYGKIGINTTTPAADIDVQGQANISNTLTALNISGTTLLVTGTYASILGNIVVGSSASISGNAAIGTSLSVGSVISATALNVTGPYASIAGNVNIGSFLNVQGSGTFGGNVVVTGFVQASNFSAAGSSTGLAGNVLIGSNLTVGGTILGTALVITGSYASVAGNLQVSSLLNVGSLITSTALNVTGPYASIAGNAAIGSVLTVGSAASFLNNISVSGTIAATNFATPGTVASIVSNVLVSSNLAVLGSISGSSLNISGTFASIAGNASVGSNLVVGSQLSATALNVTGPFASISGSVNVGSNVVIGGSLMATVLNIGGSYSSLAGGISVGGLITNNNLGNLHLKVYDESAVYNNVGAGSVGGALPAMFTSKPTMTQHANTINLTNQTFGTLTGKYSLRYAGYVQPPSTGTYTFRVTYQDGATLWIGVEKMINSWQYQAGTTSATATLTMYANMWSPFSLEHTCATSAQKLLVEWNVNGGTYTVLQHAISNFQFGYEIGDLPHTQLSTTYVSGQLFAGDSIVAQSGVVLPNSSVFTGATSQLYNDAGFVTYLGATNSASAASLTQLTASTITVSSLSATLTYLSTLTVGTILNFSAGGSLGTNLILSGSLSAVFGSVSTLTVGSLSTTFLQASTLSSSTYLNVVFNQTISSSGTTSTTYSTGTLAVGGGGSFTGTVLAACFTNQSAPLYTLDINGAGRHVTSGALPLLIQTGSSTSNGLQIQLSGTGGAQDVGIGFNQAGITSYGIVQRAGSNGRLAFVNNLYPGNAGTEQVCINNGNVGIGVTSPVLTLDVFGVIGRSLGGNTVYSCPNGLSHSWQINQSSTNALTFNQTGFYPATDNLFALGASGQRWSNISSASATISGTLMASGLSAGTVVANQLCSDKWDDPLQKNIALHWNFRYSKGTAAAGDIIYDSSPNANNGLVASAGYVISSTVTAQPYDGLRGCYMNCGTLGNTNIPFSTPITSSNYSVSLWFKPTNLGYNNWRQTFLADASGNTQHFCVFAFSPPNCLGFVMGGTRTNSNATLTNNLWHHLALTASGSNASIYLNSNLVLTSSAYIPPSSNAITQFGIASNGTVYGPIGLVEDLRIWTRQLSSSEVRVLYSQNTAVVQDVNTGNVNLGTLTVTGSLTVLGTVSVSNPFIATGMGGLGTGTLTSSFAGQGLYFGWNRNGSSGTGIIANQIGGGNVGGFEFLNYNNAGSLSNVAMSILNNGFVGINNTSPACVLDVAGASRFSGGIVPLVSWTTATYQNGWGSFGGQIAAQYMKDAHGFVHLRGVVSGGSSGSAVFQLPVGCRPAYNTNLICLSSVGATPMYPQSSNQSTPGAVLVNPPSGFAWVDLNATFYADA